MSDKNPPLYHTLPGRILESAIMCVAAFVCYVIFVLCVYGDVTGSRMEQLIMVTLGVILTVGVFATCFMVLTVKDRMDPVAVEDVGHEG